MNRLVEIVAEKLTYYRHNCPDNRSICQSESEEDCDQCIARSLLLTLQQNGVRVVDEDQDFPDTDTDTSPDSAQREMFKDGFRKVKPLVEG
jgi:predicted  nucleic acid-binding Zn ribbon protein